MKKDVQLMQEIEKKIVEMEAEDYVFPKRFSRGDYIVTAVVGTVCLTLIIVGAAL